MKPSCIVERDLAIYEREESMRQALDEAIELRIGRVFTDLENWIESELAFGRIDTQCHGETAADFLIYLLENADLANVLDKWKNDTATTIVKEEFDK